MQHIAVGHSSGKWDRTNTPAFGLSVRTMRGGGRTVVTRTEATAVSFNDKVNIPDDGWGVWHPKEGLGHDCSVEWDQEAWKKIDKGVLQLTDIRIRTKGGVLLQPCALTWITMENRDTGIEVETGSAHLDLSNTPLRRKANLEECHTLRTHYSIERRKHPHREFILNFDGNRDQRQARYRAYFRSEMFAGTSLQSAWHQPYPTMGTHGRALLDLTASSVVGKSRLLPDDSSSDHRPMETDLWLGPA